ncbi:hypothetical protein CR513_36887, partial [Mucuna pruriens]
MSGNKGLTQMWVNQTTFDKENVVEHSSTLQLDYDIQAFSKEDKPLGSCGLTMKGKSFNISGSIPQRIWILDSGTTYYMTLFFSYFTSYLKVSKKQLIIVANGDHVPIVRYGNSGLYYLQHTKISNNVNKEDLPSSQRATLETWATSQIWLYHKHLGHPPFELLKTIFPHLFTKEHVESFKCDVC